MNLLINFQPNRVQLQKNLQQDQTKLPAKPNKSNHNQNHNHDRNTKLAHNFMILKCEITAQNKKGKYHDYNSVSKKLLKNQNRGEFQGFVRRNLKEEDFLSLKRGFFVGLN